MQHCAVLLCQYDEVAMKSCHVPRLWFLMFGRANSSINDPNDAPSAHLRRSTAPPTPWSLSHLLNRGHGIGCVIWPRPDLVNINLFSSLTGHLIRTEVSGPPRRKLLYKASAIRKVAPSSSGCALTVAPDAALVVRLGVRRK